MLYKYSKKIDSSNSGSYSAPACFFAERWAESSLKFCLAPSNNQNLGQVENEYKKVATSPRRHTHTTFTTQPSLLIRSNNSPNQLKVYENNNITGIAGGDVSKCWEKWGKWGKSLEGWKNRQVMRCGKITIEVILIEKIHFLLKCLPQNMALERILSHLVHIW